MSGLQAELDHAFSTAVQERRVPGIAAIALDSHGNTLFKGTYGSLNVSDPAADPLTSATQMRVFSLTKLVTVVAALQLLEQGKFHPEDAVEMYVPSIRDIEVLEGFNEQGDPILRPVRTKATMRHLMTHTAGSTYDFLDENTSQYRNWFWDRRGESVPTTLRQEVYTFPLAFDPGTAYSYGISIEWLGLAIEAIAETTLDRYLDQKIFRPLGMEQTGNVHPPEQWIHVPQGDGTVTGVSPAGNDEVHGGQYLNSSLDEYSTFLVTILNRGIHPTSGVRLLGENTVRTYLFENQIATVLQRSPSTAACANAGQIGVFRTADPKMCNDGELLPGVSKSWSLGLMLAEEPVKHGRCAGSGSWAGLGNCYYWLDPSAGKLGLVMTTLLPFMNEQVLGLCQQLESAVYGHPVTRL